MAAAHLVALGRVAVLPDPAAGADAGRQIPARPTHCRHSARGALRGLSRPVPVADPGEPERSLLHDPDPRLGNAGRRTGVPGGPPRLVQRRAPGARIARLRPDHRHGTAARQAEPVAGLARDSAGGRRRAGAAGGARALVVDRQPAGAVAGYALLFDLPVALAAGSGAGLPGAARRSAVGFGRGGRLAAAWPSLLHPGRSAGAARPGEAARLASRAGAGHRAGAGRHRCPAGPPQRLSRSSA